jgi:hypothetical protein
MHSFCGRASGPRTRQGAPCDRRVERCLEIPQPPTCSDDDADESIELSVLLVVEPPALGKRARADEALRDENSVIVHRQCDEEMEVERLKRRTRRMPDAGLGVSTGREHQARHLGVRPPLSATRLTAMRYPT